jgi:IS30 family transposase
MGKARPLSDQELDRITQLHADGVSCTQIAKDLGRA